MSLKQTLILVALNVVLFAISPAGAADYNSRLTIPYSDMYSTYLTGLSANGQTATGTAYFSNGGFNGAQAFTWSAGGDVTPLGLMAGTIGTYSSGISADGSTIIGAGNTGSDTKAFAWTQSGGFTDLGNIGAGYYGYQPIAVSGNGSSILGSSSYIARYDYYGNPVAGTVYWLWTQSQGMQKIDAFDNVSFVTAMSRDGQTFVGSRYLNSYETEAFSWTEAGGFTSLGTYQNPAYDSYWQDAGRATAISADGTTIVGEVVSGMRADYSPTREPFVWIEENGMLGLGSAPGQYSPYGVPLAVSADGSTIGGWTSQTNGMTRTAFLWDEQNGIRNLYDILADVDLSLNNFIPTDVVALSDDGLTLGVNGQYYEYGQYRQGAMVVKLPSAPVPEPSTLLLLGAGLATAGLLKRKSRKH